MFLERFRPRFLYFLLFCYWLLDTFDLGPVYPMIIEFVWYINRDYSKHAITRVGGHKKSVPDIAEFPVVFTRIDITTMWLSCTVFVLQWSTSLNHYICLQQFPQFDQHRETTKQTYLTKYQNSYQTISQTMPEISCKRGSIKREGNNKWLV